MVRLGIGSDEVVVEGVRSLTPTQRSTLALWAFRMPEEADRGVSRTTDVRRVLAKTHQYLLGQDVTAELSPAAEAALRELEEDREALRRTREAGLRIKAGEIPTDAEEFLRFTRRRLHRRLRPHQERAALFMRNVQNSANFSVPGSGKSSVALAVFLWLREVEGVRSLFIVGPRSCFGPWQYEYRETLGEDPDVRILAGGSRIDRRVYYTPTADAIADLYLTTYQTLWQDVEQVDALFRHPANRAFFIVDEAHYIKREDGAWATSVLRVAAQADYRCVLTGTPFPHSYADAINIFDVSYPRASPFNPERRRAIRQASASADHERAHDLVRPIIEPLFYRVRKRDLELSDPVYNPPQTIHMNPIGRRLYLAIVSRIRDLSTADIERDYWTLHNLRRGRLTRVRQVLSYPALLNTAIVDYDEDLLASEPSLTAEIARYDELETPAKITALIAKIDTLQSQNEKVVVWSSFVRTLYRIRSACIENGWSAEVICGDTPTEERENDRTREQIIEEFKRMGSGLDILIANPAACAESISLHQTCSNAIYYDLSYNCAEYLQSLDRIHRVGGSETKMSYYHYLQYADTIEPRVLENLQEKTARMERIVDGDFPFRDADLPDLEREAYEALFE